MEDVFVDEVVANTEMGIPRDYYIEQLFDLLSQLLRDTPDRAEIRKTIEAENSLLFAAWMQRPEGGLPDPAQYIMVGTATLIRMQTPHGLVGYVHDVMVDDKRKGFGVGKQLVSHILQIAKANSMVEVNLTTNAKVRPAAEHLYLSFDFEKKDTGFYVKKL